MIQRHTALLTILWAITTLLLGSKLYLSSSTTPTTAPSPPLPILSQSLPQSLPPTQQYTQQQLLGQQCPDSPQCNIYTYYMQQLAIQRDRVYKDVLSRSKPIRMLWLTTYWNYQTFMDRHWFFKYAYIHHTHITHITPYIIT